MTHRSLSWLLLVPALAACAATGGHAGAQCSVGAECTSGICTVDGVCADSSGAGGASSSSSSTSSSTSTSTSSSSTGSGAGGSGSGGGSVCSPNKDGMITRAEVPLQAGLHATFRAAENATVDMAGKTLGDGSRVWDLDVALPGDHGELVETLPLAGQWFAADFAGSTYAARLSDTQTLLGVFEVTADALLLHGVVSPTGGATQTELKYQPPVKVLSFPIQAGGSWTTNAAVSGQASGVPGVYSEIYQSSVDAHGTMKTPFGTFDVQRVRTDLTRTTGAVVTTSRSFTFVTECFGSIANVTSQTYEMTVEFTKAAEVVRLAP